MDDDILPLTKKRKLDMENILLNFLQALRLL